MLLDFIMMQCAQCAHTYGLSDTYGFERRERVYMRLLKKNCSVLPNYNINALVLHSLIHIHIHTHTRTLQYLLLTCRVIFWLRHSCK